MSETTVAKLKEELRRLKAALRAARLQDGQLQSLAGVKATATINGVELSTPPHLSASGPMVIHLAVTEAEAERLRRAGVEIAIDFRLKPWAEGRPKKP